MFILHFNTMISIDLIEYRQATDTLIFFKLKFGFQFDKSGF